MSTPFKNKSQFLPSSNLNPAIVTYNQLVENGIAKILQKKVPVRMNLSDTELKALQNLEKRKDIIIHSADKGGSVVVMSFEQYDKGIKSQLHDTQCYIPLNSNPTEQIKQRLIYI